MTDFRRQPGRGFKPLTNNSNQPSRLGYTTEDGQDSHVIAHGGYDTAFQPRGVNDVTQSNLNQAQAARAVLPVRDNTSTTDRNSLNERERRPAWDSNAYARQRADTISIDDGLPPGLGIDGLYSIDESLDDVATQIDPPKARTLGSKKTPSSPDNNNHQKTKKKRFLRRLLIFLLVCVVIVVGAYWWYWQSLKPVNSISVTTKSVTITTGTSPNVIAKTLKEQGLIRDVWAFEVYTRLTNLRNQLKAGTCQFNTSQSLPEIVDKLTKGCHDSRVVTFFPGATLVDSVYKPQQQDVTSALKRSGYSDEAIKAALAKTYNSPLFADKPAGTSLEGYVYGDTYNVPADQGPEVALQAAFAHMYKQLQDNNLINKFKAQNLNLYQAITLASIVQREMGCSSGSQPCYQIQRQIAQVFYKRLRQGSVLGSDVTFIYGADLLGVTPTVNLDSPYNTRIKTGLPPGPIAAPGLGALKAVADPAPGNYEFFVAGDDGNVYFATTESEHQANIKKYCQKLCAEL